MGGELGLRSRIWVVRWGSWRLVVVLLLVSLLLLLPVMVRLGLAPLLDLPILRGFLAVFLRGRTPRVAAPCCVPLRLDRGYTRLLKHGVVLARFGKWVVLLEQLLSNVGSR
jgi:hypothetical protein